MDQYCYVETVLMLPLQELCIVDYAGPESSRNA